MERWRYGEKWRERGSEGDRTLIELGRRETEERSRGRAVIWKGKVVRG